MIEPAKINLKVYQGSTFKRSIRWESSTKKYVPITGISKSAPVVITAQNHNIPANWRVKVTGVAGMKEINSEDYRIADTVTANTVSFNDINSLGYTTYTTGGVLEYNQPAPLANYTARLQVRNYVDSQEVLLELTTQNGGIQIDAVNSVIHILISAQLTAALNFRSALYGLELVSNQDVVQFATGTITLIKEVTR